MSDSFVDEQSSKANPGYLQILDVRLYEDRHGFGMLALHGYHNNVIRRLWLFGSSIRSGGLSIMDANLQQRVLKVIAEMLDRKENEIRLDVSLRDDLQMDSLKLMTLFIVLEDEFQRSIPPEEVVGLVTVKDVIDFIDGKVHEPSPA